MNVDKQIFDLVERIGRLMRDLELADTASESGTPIAIAMANEAWRKASRELNDIMSALAALEPESFPAAAALADAASATGSPLLIAALRDWLLRQAIRQADAAEHHQARIEDEPPIGMLPDGSLNLERAFRPRIVKSAPAVHHDEPN
jgi:hypothetical protein